MRRLRLVPRRARARRTSPPCSRRRSCRRSRAPGSAGASGTSTSVLRGESSDTVASAGTRPAVGVRAAAATCPPSRTARLHRSADAGRLSRARPASSIRRCRSAAQAPTCCAGVPSACSIGSRVSRRSARQGRVTGTPSRTALDEALFEPAPPARAGARARPGRPALRHLPRRDAPRAGRAASARHSRSCWTSPASASGRPRSTARRFWLFWAGRRAVTRRITLPAV